jgi:hypothetical protein
MFGLSMGEALILKGAHANESQLLGTIRALQAQIASLTEERNEALNGRNQAIGQLAVEQCFSSGLAAAVNAFKEVHPDSPLLRKTGRTLSNDTPETVLSSEHFTPAFDRAAADRRVAHPERFRPSPLK